MKYCLFFFAILFISYTKANDSIPVYHKPAQLLQYTLVNHLSKKDLQVFYKKSKVPESLFHITNEIDVYEIFYTTRTYDSSIVKVSGLVYMPISKEKKFRLIYTHGTESCKDRSPLRGERAICVLYSADNYIVIAPDYIGLGKSELDQLYMNAYTEAHSTVDMLIATEELFSKLKIETEKELLITGYSQGAHAAMATHRLLQNEYANQYSVKASAPMSGPYDVESTIMNGVKKPYCHPALFVLFLKSFCIVNNKPNDFSRILTAPYDSLLPPLFNGSYGLFEIDKVLPQVAGNIVDKDFLYDIENNKESDFRKYAKANNVYDWKPEAPMQLCYCRDDKQVDPKNTMKAYETMKKNGTNNLFLKQAGKKFDHTNCALFSMVYTKTFLDGYRKGIPNNKLPFSKKVFVNTMKLLVKP